MGRLEGNKFYALLSINPETPCDNDPEQEVGRGNASEDPKGLTPHYPPPPPSPKKRKRVQNDDKSDDDILEEAIETSERERGLIRLQSQDERCAARLAQLAGEGWIPLAEQRNQSLQRQETPEQQEEVHKNGEQAAAVAASVLPQEVRAIEEVVGKKFTFDASSYELGINPQGVPSCSRQAPYCSQDLRGHHALIAVPVAQLKDAIEQYLAHKAESPSNTSACFLVPIWRELPHGALAKMEIVKEYRKGYHLFGKHSGDKGFTRFKGISTGVRVYYDAPEQVAIEPDKQMLMQYKSRVHGVKCSVLLDTGAEGYAFISAQFCNRNKVHISKQSREELVLGDGHKAHTHGTATVSVHIQGYHARKLTCTVMDMPESFDLILGQDWLLQHKAVLHVAEGLCVLHHKGSKVSLSNKEVVAKYKDHAKWTQQSGEEDEGIVEVHPQPSKVATISVMAAKRAVRKGASTYMVLVKPGDQASLQEQEDTDSHALKQLKAQYADVFKEQLPGPPPDRPGVPQFEAIRLVDENIKFRPMPRYSPKEKECIRQEIGNLLAQGLIQPSNSPFGSPILFVVDHKKPTGLRLVTDYRAVNAKTIKDRYPLPRIDDLLDSLSGAKYFSALDLTSGYHQLRLMPSDMPKTAIVVPEGVYEWKVLSMGLSNAPAVFAKTMAHIFKPFINKFVLIYLDDILVYSKTEEEHYEHLRQVFETLRQYKLYCKPHKCQFMKEEVAYLGHVVTRDGVKPDPKKIAAVDGWVVPKTVKQLRSFLGFANYFRKFIQGYSRMVSPLTDLTKNVCKKFQNITHKWTPKCQESFEAVKYALTHAPVLTMPDFTKPFEVVTDACGDQHSGGLGAVLMQEGRPIAYESRKLVDAELRYTTTEQELLGVVHALKVWRCYLEGVKFTVVTDHCPNTFFQTLPELNRRQARWAETLQLFDFEWEYRPGRINVADPLSRIPGESPVTTQSQAIAALCRRVAAASPAITGSAPVVASTPLIDLVRVGYKNDKSLEDEKFVARHKLNKSVDDLWWKGTRLVIPDNSDLKEQLFTGAHAHVYAGHFGAQKTEELLERHFWWPGLRPYVKEAVKKCDTCQRNKPLSMKPAGKLMPLPIPGHQWQTVTLDFITDLPMSTNSNDAVCVWVDKLSKMVHISPITGEIEAEHLAEIFLKDIFRLHGLPKEFIHDRGAVFMSRFFTKVCEALHIKQLPSSAYHPQTDGQTERVNRVLEDTLRHYVSADHSNWEGLLPMVEFAINNSKHASSQCTPFYLNYGRHPLTPLSAQLPSKGQIEVNAPAAAKFVAKMQDALTEAKKHLEAAQQRMKHYADKKRSVDPKFDVGSEVLLSTKNIKLKHPGSTKLLPKWIGPFKVIKKISSVAFKLELPDTLTKLHPVFHSSLLKPYVRNGNYQPPPPLLMDDGSVEYEVEALLDYRERKVQGTSKKIPEYLVKWMGYSHEHNTWEPLDNLTHCGDLVQAYQAVRVANPEERVPGERRRAKRQRMSR